MRIAISSAMMEITTKSSINVNAFRFAIIVLSACSGMSTRQLQRPHVVVSVLGPTIHSMLSLAAASVKARSSIFGSALQGFDITAISGTLSRFSGLENGEPLTNAKKACFSGQTCIFYGSCPNFFVDRGFGNWYKSNKKEPKEDGACAQFLLTFVPGWCDHVDGGLSCVCVTTGGQELRSR